jgi:heme-degrading monooxygenase HmoA
MFLLNEMLRFAPGRRQEALDRLAWIHGLMASQPGFRRAIVARYLGDGLKHTVMRMWDDAAAYQRFRAGPDGNYGKSRPPGLYVNDQVVPQWESVVEAQGDSEGGHIVKVHQAVPEDGWEAWIEHQKRLHDIRQSAGGLAGVWTFRALDRSESLSLAHYSDRSDHQRFVDSEDFAKAFVDQPDGVTLLSVQAFDVVSEIAPKA